MNLSYNRNDFPSCYIYRIDKWAAKHTLNTTTSTRHSLGIWHLKTIFGHTHRPHNKSKRGRGTGVVKAVDAPSYDLTVLKVKWGNLTLKIYDKNERVLRVEVVVSNAKELR